MDGTKIMNHLDRFHSDVQQFSTSTDHLKITTNRLFATLESLNATWSGAAHNVYVANVNEDKELMDSIFRALRSLGSELSQADKIYRNCEKTVEQEINKLVV